VIRRIRQAFRRFTTSSPDMWIMVLDGGLVVVPAGLVSHVWPKPADWVYVRDRDEAERFYAEVMARLERPQ
jgi:hypothetical protein